jgi:hypothetical protein
VRLEAEVDRGRAINHELSRLELECGRRRAHTVGAPAASLGLRAPARRQASNAAAPRVGALDHARTAVERRHGEAGDRKGCANIAWRHGTTPRRYVASDFERGGRALMAIEALRR